MQAMPRGSIRVGYCLSLTGPLSGNCKSAQLTHHIWRESINARGGLLGRSVELVCRDDRGDASLVPGIYQRLIDEEGVDLAIGCHRRSEIRQKPPNSALTEGFFAPAAAQVPKPTTVALVMADAEFSRNPVLGAQVNAEKFDLRIVQNTVYSLSTRDFLPLIDSVSQSGCNVLFLCPYLADTIGLVRAIRAHRFRPKIAGGAMIGPQNSEVKLALDPLLNGFVNYEYWVPGPRMMFPGIQQVLEVYQTRAANDGVDLGHYMAPLAYAQMQVVAKAIKATGRLDDAQLSAYARGATFETVMGEVRFGRNGEWARPRVLQVQFRGISGHDLNQFRNGARQIVLSPPDFASGQLRYPYDETIVETPADLR